jgi:hypothetical protein
LEHGVTRAQVEAALAQRRWLRAAPGLYALASWPASAHRRLLGACLATGGVASHASAAWVWGLLKEAPTPPVVSVAHRCKNTMPATGGGRIAISDGYGDTYPAVVHRSRDLPSASISLRRGIPTTNPLRSLVDLAATSSPTVLDDAIDVALAKRLVSVESLEAEALRLKRPGRRGPPQLIARLGGRRFVGASAPSVLESRALRLLAEAGIKVVNCETVVDAADSGHYRLDIELENKVFLEVDGFAYHSSPEQKNNDDARRNQLRLHGIDFLVYDWRALMEGTGGRLITEAREALRAKAVLATATKPTAELRPYPSSTEGNYR